MYELIANACSFRMYLLIANACSFRMYVQGLIIVGLNWFPPNIPRFVKKGNTD